MGGGGRRGAARPAGRGSPRQGTRGEEEAGSQSGSIRFSHRPRCGSQQLGRREEWQRPGSPVSRRLSARRGPQAPGTRLPRRQDAQEEGQLRRRGRQGRGEFGAFCGGWWVSREPLACLPFSLTLLFLFPSPRGDRRGCQLNLLPKWKRSRKRQQRRINLQTKKCKQKGRGEQRENRPKWLTKKLKKIYLQKTGKRKLRRVQPLMKQERKKPSLINTIYHVLPVVPVSLLVQSRGIFLSTIL
nr:non-histone chromosomal protein HMG-14 isoform X1 [Chlorocebus sabaeus]